MTRVSEPQPEQSSEVVCPHCKKPFEAELLSDENGRQQGYKCPHCRLFVSLKRANEPDLI